MDVAVVAQEAVNGTVEPVTMLFCLVPIKETIELLFQKEDVADQEEVTAQLAVIGNVLPVETVPGALSADKDLEAQLALTELNELVAQRDCVAQTAVFGMKLMDVAIVAQLLVIGNVLPVLIVPGALSDANDLLAHDELTELKELVAQRDCVAHTDVFGTKLIAVAIVAQLAVQGTVDPVAILFCFVPIKLTTELLFQKEAVADQEEVTDQLAVIG